jgi:hypothetical protein
VPLLRLPTRSFEVADAREHDDYEARRQGLAYSFVEEVDGTRP